MADLFGRLHTAGNGGMQSCEIILLHEGADLVGMHGLKRIQQARGDALAADADAAQLMPDDAPPSVCMVSSLRRSGVSRLRSSALSSR